MNKKISTSLAFGVTGVLTILLIATIWYLWNGIKTENSPVITLIKRNKIEQNNVGIANPASVFCEQNGGKLEIITAEDGGQSGMCKFSDGSECEEWKFMRGECKVSDSQSQTDTSDWQTYQNDEYGFEFKYPVEWGVSKDLVKYSENGDKYNRLRIYDIALANASKELEEKNQSPWTGINPYRAIVVCNTNQEFFYNEDTFRKNITTKKQVSEKGMLILEAEKSILMSGKISIRMYKYIDGDTGMQAVAYWENDKMYCISEPELSPPAIVSDQQKQQRIVEWEKILSTFKFIN